MSKLYVAIHRIVFESWPMDTAKLREFYKGIIVPLRANQSFLSLSSLTHATNTKSMFGLLIINEDSSWVPMPLVAYGMHPLYLLD